LGAHGLGGAKTENSGYDEKWTPDENVELLYVLDNAFYLVMLDPGIKWFNVDAALSDNFTGSGHCWQCNGRV
jgi:hypothetical protein